MGGHDAAAGQSWERLRQGLNAWIGSVLLALLLLGAVLAPLPCSGAAAWAFELPGLGLKGQSQSSSRDPLAASRPSGRLQEVAPPLAVQQLQDALAERLPQVEILSPRDGARLNSGPWELKARVRDWPIANAGSLGLGAHVVVQIDDLEPLRLSGDPDNLSIEVPELSPGSHRITVYAAKPWGEVVKSPGAIQQLRVHRIAANPLALPAPGTPQLLPVSPLASGSGEPLLLDWILLDAPLQNLRPGDGSWRLRVTVNGDSFLLDQNVPLWLQGWRSGSNSLLLELVDGLGEPLNAPFNSKVIEVNLQPGNANGVKPRWLQGRLNEQDLAVLLGQMPPPDESALELQEPSEPEPEAEGPGEQAALPAVSEPSEPELSEPEPETPAPNLVEQSLNEAPTPPLDKGNTEPEVVEQPSGASISAEGVLGEPELTEPDLVQDRADLELLEQDEAEVARTGEADAEIAVSDNSASDTLGVFEDSTANPGSKRSVSEQTDSESSVSEQRTAEPMVSEQTAAEEAATESTVGAHNTSDQTSSKPITTEEHQLMPQAPVLLSPDRPRVGTSTSLEGRARDLVNADGSLVKPKPSGPLAGLRQRLSS